ncbi:NUDIX hydrolase [Actinoplanes sp. NPDC051346]|uniref:NUDIX hydrolase n=1 Tax=Actinoplanes sp. NPDC051346 TaxID=3155048 RepID=UPI003444DAC2
MKSPLVDDCRPVAAAVIVDDGRVLLVRRRVKEGRLSWQFPAGKVEPGESADGAAVREALEEAGVAVCAVRGLGQRVHRESGRTMVYIASHFVGGSAHAADGEEIAEVAWCDRAAVATYVPYPLYGPVQEYLDDNL